MKLSTFNIKNTVKDIAEKEIRFDVATARAQKSDIVCFYLESEIDRAGNFCKSIAKVLRAMKREGRIDCFAFKDDFSANNTVASYLLNKEETLADKVMGDEFFAVVKL